LLAPRQKILLGFALTGFLIGPAILFYSNRLLHQAAPNQGLLAILCPPSRLSLALQGSTQLGDIVGWGFLSAINAFLYALVGILVALLVPNSN
jgi:hypothetical protein